MALGDLTPSTWAQAFLCPTSWTTDVKLNFSVVLVLERPCLGKLLREVGATMALAGSQRGWRAVTGGGTGPDGFFRSFRAGASKASALFPVGMPWNARTIFPCQRCHTWLYPSLWHHVTFHAGVWVGWTCQALGLYLTFLLTLAQPGDFQALALAFPGRCSRAQYTLKMRKRLLGRSMLGLRAGRLEGFRLSSLGKEGYSVSGSTKIGARSPWLVLRTPGQVPSLSLAQMCTSVT